MFFFKGNNEFANGKTPRNVLRFYSDLRYHRTIQPNCVRHFTAYMANFVTQAYYYY